MQRLRNIPFLILLIPLVAGILYGYFIKSVSPILYCTVTISCLLCCLAACLIPTARIHLCSIALLLFLLLTGIVLTKHQLHTSDYHYPSTPSVYQIHLIGIPQPRERSVRCEAEVVQCFRNDTITPIHKRILLSLQNDTAANRLQQGDIILLHTTITMPHNGNPDSFRYDNYLRLQGFSGSAFGYSGTWNKIGHQPIHTLTAKAQQCQQALVHTLRLQGFSERQLSVLTALSLGYRDELDNDTKQQFSNAGAMHVLAVSGLHVGIIYGVLMGLLTCFGIFPVQYRQYHRRGINTLIIIFFLWAYAFLTGMSPSVLRSALMFSLLCIGNALERESNTYNTIAASAFITLLIHPLMLYSISFILSYSAVLAIILLMPKLSALIHFRYQPIRWLWNLICLSIAAQAGTLPWTLYWFGHTSNFFILTNILVVPLAGFIIYTVLLLFLLIATPLAWVPLYLLKVETFILTAGVEFIDQLPGATSSVPLTLPMLWCLWGALICIITAFLRHKIIPLAGAMLCCILLLLSAC